SFSLTLCDLSPFPTRRSSDLREYVLPYSTEILEHVAGVVPRIHFGVGTGELLPAMAEAGSEVMGVDYRVRMDEAAERIHAVVHRSEEHTSELQSRFDLVCRLL